MLSIAHIMAGAATGGAELFYERLCIAQHRAGDRVWPLLRKNRAREAKLRQAGLTPHSFAFGGAWDVITPLLLGRTLRRLRPDIAIAWMGRAAHHTPRGDYVLAGRLGGYYDLDRFAKCQFLLANTEGLKNWIIGQGYPAPRVAVVPNFVANHLGALPATLPVPPGNKIILGLGRLHRHKGFDVLIASLTHLPPSVHAVIAGDGPERATLQELAARARLQDRVHFLGWRDDIAALLAACDVFVCSSRVEVLGNMVLDAFSAQKPVVAAMAQGPSELITPGKNGVLVPVDSAIALAAGIGSVLDGAGMAQKIAAAGRDDFLARHTEQAVVATWRDVLNSGIAR